MKDHPMTLAVETCAKAMWMTGKMKPLEKMKDKVKGHECGTCTICVVVVQHFQVIFVLNCVIELLYY